MRRLETLIHMSTGESQSHAPLTHLVFVFVCVTVPPRGLPAAPRKFKTNLPSPQPSSTPRCTANSSHTLCVYNRAFVELLPPQPKRVEYELLHRVDKG